MKLSARTRYAARILLELARNKGVSPVSAAMLSQRTGISVQFIEQILKPLKQKNITSSVRGAAGGHWLAKSADDVSLGEIVRIMEGDIALSECCGHPPKACPRKEGCVTHLAWSKASRVLANALDSISLSFLLHTDEQGQPKIKHAQLELKPFGFFEAPTL